MSRKFHHADSPGASGECRLGSYALSVIPYCLGALVLAGLLAACGSNQIHSSSDYRDIDLAPGDLETHGLAFITPSTITGREEDKQTLAFVFYEVITEERPLIRVISLPETLSAVNQAAMADEYKQMYVDYRDTGIFKYDSLKKTGEATGVRYLVQLKLASFVQNSKGRFNLLGLRLFQTKEANVRVFFQIWNSDNGAIVWEGTEEMNYARDTGSEKPVTFKRVVEALARNLISKLPE